MKFLPYRKNRFHQKLSKKNFGIAKSDNSFSSSLVFVIDAWSIDIPACMLVWRIGLAIYPLVGMAPINASRGLIKVFIHVYRCGASEMWFDGYSSLFEAFRRSRNSSCYRLVQGLLSWAVSDELSSSTLQVSKSSDGKISFWESFWKLSWIHHGCLVSWRWLCDSLMVRVSNLLYSRHPLWQAKGDWIIWLMLLLPWRLRSFRRRVWRKLVFYIITNCLLLWQ